MLNAVNFLEEASRFRKSATRRSPVDAIADISGLGFRFRILESKATTELRDAILLLDLAFQHAYRLVEADPALRKLFEDGLLIIEELCNPPGRRCCGSESRAPRGARWKRENS